METFTWEAALQFAAERYGAPPEYLWASDPEAAVLRRTDTGKWFALYMRVPRARLGLPGEGKAALLDLKCDPLLTGALRAREGFLPAYHMNKERWVAVLLDGPVDREEGCALLEESWRLAGPKIKRRRSPKPDETAAL